MTTYATFKEVTTRYAVIKSWGKTEIEVSSDLIHYAEVELNSRLASHFDVPFPVAYPTIKDLTIELTYYRAMLTRDPDKAVKIHDAIIGRIEDLKEGKEYIFTGSETIIPSGADQVIWSPLMDFHPVHSMLDAESPYTAVDSSLIDELESERS